MEFQVTKGDKMRVMTQQEVYDMLLPGMFTSMLMRLEVGMSMYHYDTTNDFKRIK